MKKYTVTLVTMVVEEVEADSEEEAIQLAKETVDYYSGRDCDWVVEEIEEEWIYN